MQTALLADADRELCDIYRFVLSQIGFQVDAAGDGLECLAKLRCFVPDLLILDLGLPWGGGDGVLGLLRENPRLLPNRVLLTSAIASPEFLESLASPPRVQAMKKPLTPSTMLERVSFGASDEPMHRSGGKLFQMEEIARVV